MKHSLTAWLLLVNALGASVYLVVASRLWWIEPEVAHIPGASGGAAFIWFLVSMYFAFAFIAVNLAALISHIVALISKNGSRLNFYAFSIPAMRLAAVWIDFQHHGA